MTGLVDLVHARLAAVERDEDDADLQEAAEHFVERWQRSDTWPVCRRQVVKVLEGRCWPEDVYRALLLIDEDDALILGYGYWAAIC